MIASRFNTKNDNINPNNKHLWIKKAIGLGISEFMLRFMSWLCLKDSALSGSQMCIVTGPRIDLAIVLIGRMKRLFAGKGLVALDTKETVVELNCVKIDAFPSHHLDVMRGLPNVSFILLAALVSGIGTDIIKRWLTRPRIFVCEESVQVEFNYPVSKKASEYDQVSFCL